MFRELSAAFFYPGGSIMVSHRIDASGDFGNVFKRQIKISFSDRDQRDVF